MRAVIAFAGVSLLLASCTNPDGTTNNQGTDSLVGGGAGALTGGILGRLIGGNGTSTALGALAGGAVGFFAGSYIGSQLDQRDRQLALQSTNEALEQPVYVPPPGHTSYVHHPRPHHWTSDHTTASGSTTVEKVSVNPDGGQCKSLRQIAVIKGQEVTQDVNYCQTASGGWKATTA